MTDDLPEIFAVCRVACDVLDAQAAIVLVIRESSGRLDFSCAGAGTSLKEDHKDNVCALTDAVREFAMQWIRQREAQDAAPQDAGAAEGKEQRDG